MVLDKKKRHHPSIFEAMLLTLSTLDFKATLLGLLWYIGEGSFLVGMKSRERGWKHLTFHRNSCFLFHLDYFFGFIIFYGTFQDWIVCNRTKKFFNGFLYLDIFCIFFKINIIFNCYLINYISFCDCNKVSYWTSQQVFT